MMRKRKLKVIDLWVPDRNFRCSKCEGVSWDNADYAVNRVNSFYLNPDCQTCAGTGLEPIPWTEVS